MRAASTNGRVMKTKVSDGKSEYLDMLIVAAAPVNLRPALNLVMELASWRRETFDALDR